MAFRAFWNAMRGGFTMDAARPEFQLREHGQTVPWEDNFVEELKSCLLVCRTL
jgi:proton-dependent oligopeptide transporter, POT family